MNRLSFDGIAARIGLGYRLPARKDEDRTTTNETGSITEYRLTKDEIYGGFIQTLVWLIVLPTLLFATKYAGEFQELDVGGRASGMGGTGIAQFEDPAVIYFNPAGSFFNQGGVLIMHAENFAGGVKNDFGSVVFSKETMAFGVGAQYVSVGDIKLTTLADTSAPPGSENQPIPYDTVGTKDFVLYINGAKGNEILSYGANVKVFYRDLAVITGYGGGLDLGLAINLAYLRAGLAIRDFVLSPLIWSNGTKETINPKVSFGIAPCLPLAKINSAFTLACDFTKYLDRDGFQINLGLEYSYKDLVFGRFGLHEGNYTIGLGLAYKSFCLDYALVTHSDLENSNKFSAGLKFK